MEKGSYNGRRVPFWRYTASRFDPYLFASGANAGFGCGATALALLTGIFPRSIAHENGDHHFPDEFMVQFLRRHRYGVQQLTLCNVSASESNIGPEHVVLLSQLFRRNEATWGVIYSGIYFHNFAVYQLENLSLLNKPVLSAYLVIHPRWRPLRSSPRKSGSLEPKLRKANSVSRRISRPRFGQPIVSIVNKDV